MMMSHLVRNQMSKFWDGICAPLSDMIKEIY
jgi:hypothetical protein